MGPIRLCAHPRSANAGDRASILRIASRSKNTLPASRTLIILKVPDHIAFAFEIAVLIAV